MELQEDELARLAKQYVRFATVEADPTSPSYRDLCLHVAQSDRLLRFLGGLPKARRQPNLFLAAVRLIGGAPESADALEATVENRGDAVRQVMLTHVTQTNEPARCAVLLPALAQLPGPLALIEVGASAGLCLLPDRYAYDYDGAEIAPASSGLGPAPVFPCQVNDRTPVPQRNVDVVWRAGLDLNPLDVKSDADVAWLETLVWPEHRARADRLKAALHVASGDPPPLVKGNLLEDLDALAKSAPEHATLVIYHTAVLGYVSALQDRESFASNVQAMNAVWISNEAPGVFPDIAEHAPPPPSRGMFLLAVDGVATAWTDPHGRSLHWFR